MTGDELRTYRESVHLSIHRLARELDVHFTAVSHWEHGRRRVPAWVVRRLSSSTPPMYWLASTPTLRVL